MCCGICGMQACGICSEQFEVYLEYVTCGFKLYKCAFRRRIQWMQATDCIGGGSMMGGRVETPSSRSPACYGIVITACQCGRASRLHKHVFVL
jgi:hypothetical protein